MFNIDTQNIITELRLSKQDMLTNKFQDPELMQEIEHEIDIELENINDMIAIEK